MKLAVPHPLTALLGSSPKLASDIYAFNFCPADYVHPTDREQFGGALVSDEIWRARRARAALSAHILKKMGLDKQPCFDLSHPEWPLVLLDASKLNRLQRHIMAFVFSPMVRHSIMHQEVIAWKTRLGPDAYKFALNGTTLLPRLELPKAALHAARAEELAYGCIEAAMSTAVEPLLLRARLKLPCSRIKPDTDAASAKRLVYALLSILEPEWRLFFPATRI